jgi:hypothetical protein
MTAAGYDEIVDIPAQTAGGLHSIDPLEGSLHFKKRFKGPLE